MRKTLVGFMVLAIVLMTGCASMNDGKLSYNMTQSVSRSAGDVSMTALLDEGVNPKVVREYVNGLITLVQDETLDKMALRDAIFALATKLKLKNMSSYIDALIAVIPSHVSVVDKIPPDVRTALVSFLKDGALKGLDFYDPKRPPVKEGS